MKFDIQNKPLLMFLLQPAQAIEDHLRVVPEKSGSVEDTASWCVGVKASRLFLQNYDI